MVKAPFVITMVIIHTIVIPVKQVPQPVIIGTVQYCEKSGNRWGLELSESDIDWICRICHHEANNQSDRGVQAVAEVVLNRVYSRDFPNTVTGVLFSPGQFCSESELSKSPVTDRIKGIVLRLLEGKSDYVLSPYAMYFQRGATGHKDEIRLEDHHFRRKY